MSRASHKRSNLQGWHMFWLVILGSFLLGCQKEEIRVYRIPRERASPPEQTQAAASAPGISWKTPPGWEERAAGRLRVARFAVPGKDGLEADVSIIPLPGTTASKQEIVNIWRKQVGLPDIREEEISGLLEQVQIGGAQGELFDMVSSEPLIEDKHKARIIVAMIPQQDSFWFFKMIGEDQLVRGQKTNFLDFLKSITFETGPSAGASAPAPAGSSDRKPQWTVPSGWQEAAPGQMVLAKYRIHSQEAQKAEVTVSVFPGEVGGLLANVNRWRQQVGLPPISQAELTNTVNSLDTPAGKATVVDVSGQDASSQRKTRLVGVVLPRGNETWFYKMLGDEAVAAREKEAFLQFVQSAKYNHVH